uniref:RNA dependent RNA polymerase n=1 Tax=Flavonifractor plautii TaxID=292800 RepID=UPI0018AB6E68
MTLPIAEARRNDELISLADSQVLRWLDELNGITDADDKAKRIKAEIRRLRKEQSSLQNRRQIKKLYEQLDAIQFKPDYLCVIMDREKDYIRACKGFTINGIRYHRLLGTNGGVKNETIVFVSDRHGDELRKRIDNGRDLGKEMVAAKLEAYKALTCSASIPVSMPNGVLVVNDCETKFPADIIYINDEMDGEPFMEERPSTIVELNESDGYGIMLPSLADRWASEIGIDYRPSGVNTRFAWEKGMVFCFDFLEFANTVAGNYIVKDAWGDERDIRDVELILTTSMVKLWDSYDSCEHYLQNCIENRYTFGIAKVCPRALESERNLNYQFIQSYSLTDEDIDELIAPTMNEISDILYADYQKTVLFLKGMGLNEDNVESIEDDYVKALMIDPNMIDDPYIQSKIFQLIKNRINEAKVGVIKVHGNYSIVSGDPYSLCQSVFGLEVTGILKSGEIYNGYWADHGADQLACFRAPMTCHNNIRAVTVNRSNEAKRWYKYMNTCTVFNSWDTAAHALNGMDKDGDLVMLTDNRVLVENLHPLPALMCVQRKAKKKIVQEEDFIRANIDSFGDDIGKTTNRITAMFEVQARYPENSEEYKILDYRIKCGQLFQQNAIDKAKGIIAKPMPREWFDRHYALAIEDPNKRRIYLSILADKKPYFMRYIYPDLMKHYNTYIKNTNKKAQREFSISVEEMLEKEPDELSEREREFIHYYLACMPVGISDCVTNRICRRFERAFDG